MIWALHGAVGCASDWRDFARDLDTSSGELGGVRRLDLWRFLDCCPMPLEKFGDTLAEEIVRVDPEPVLLGYSMGGHAGYIGGDGVPRLNILDVQRKIRNLPKPVVAMVAGYAIGGGHVLHVVCDLSIAADNAIFGQTGPKVGSFDGGLGSSYLARIVGQKKAREIWYLCRQYDAQQALEMGLVNTVVPLADLEKETVQWCREMLQHSPIALRCLKSALNADCDGQMGLLDLAGNATMLYYMSEEGKEGKNAFIEKRKPDFSKFPRVP